jgi:hypothetical protein
MYGRLEILNKGFWTSVKYSSYALGPLGLTLACRSVGFAGGADVSAGGRYNYERQGALPGDDMLRQEIYSIQCNGSETRLSECAINFSPSGTYDYYDEDHDEDVSVACFNSADCAVSGHVNLKV